MYEPAPLGQAFRKLGHIAVAATLFWLASQYQASNRRIAANPHASAAIERTWTRPGKHGGRYADLSYSNAGDSGSFWCHTHGVRIGRDSRPAHIGEQIDVVPVPGSCDSPDIPSEAAPWLAVSAFYAASFVVGALALMSLVGAPLFPRRINA